LFLPAVVVPGIIFTLLALWPFIEARALHDHDTHHFAQHPSESPVRSGLGAAGVTMFVVLMLAGSNDVLAKYLAVEVDTLNQVLKVLLVALPIAIGLLTFAVCRDLKRRGSKPIGPRRAVFRRTETGGYDEEPEPRPAEDPAPPLRAERGSPSP